MKKKDSRFKFFVPLDIIEKSKDKEGNEIMIVSGVASTMDRDSDGEILDPNGFDFSYLMNSGFINWHHMTNDNPNAIIGEPIKAEVKNNEFHITAELYPWSSLAKDVYELATNLEKKTKGKRKLGWSIEGKATERDLLDEKYVKKANITGMAITPMPKNSASFLDIIKGEKTGFEEVDEDIEGDPVNGGTIQYLIDVKSPDGTRLTVDKEYNIKIDKALSTSTSSGQALTRESLEGAPKVTTYKGINPEIKKAIIVVAKAYEQNSITDDTLNNIKKSIESNQFA